MLVGRASEAGDVRATTLFWGRLRPVRGPTRSKRRVGDGAVRFGCLRRAYVNAGSQRFRVAGLGVLCAGVIIAGG